VVGRLINPRSCYVCKQRYVEVDAFYHQLCRDCAELHHAKRDARTDLSGRRALLTGGRAKIGMYIALRLLRDGAHTTITTRFPTDAVRRFTAMPDSAQWLHRLTVVGLDLRDPAQVIALADRVAARGPLDVLINNAAQTVRRTPGSYAQLVAAERAALPPGPRPEVVDLGTGPVQLTGGPDEHHSFDAHNLTALALTSGSASLDRVAAGTAIDAGGLVPDLDAVNSWTQRVDEVDALELLEVQLCNVTAPFVLVSRLRPALAASPARRTYVVNVSAMEGQFRPGLQGPGPSAHQHGQGRAQHADPHQRARDAGDRRHPDDQRRHRLDHRRAPAPDEVPAGRGGLPRPARPGRRSGAGLRPDRARRGRRGPVRRLPQGLLARRLVRSPPVGVDAAGLRRGRVVRACG
jgi:NAD(P)-dependent dehydrogenase (short-subunit alcohol dehydrogenase family)